MSPRSSHFQSIEALLTEYMILSPYDYISENSFAFLDLEKIALFFWFFFTFSGAAKTLFVGKKERNNVYGFQG